MVHKKWIVNHHIHKKWTLDLSWVSCVWPRPGAGYEKARRWGGLIGG